MKIAILAPAPVPYTPGGVEVLVSGLARAIRELTPHQVEVLKLPVDESTVAGVLRGYRAFAKLDLRGFDLVISVKYPAWMARHPFHICYMTHRLRGVYDTYPGSADWRALLDSPPWQLPGPWLRRLVHRRDNLALSPARICGHYAISRTVAGRPGYFPPEVAAEVLYPAPSLTEFGDGGMRHLLCVGRMDGPKRMDLAVRAFLKAKVKLPLVVAGEGPLAQHLQNIAAGDPRISFVGRTSDAELAQLYADALGVLYIPDREDYGYVTIEAFKSGVPVITCADSGGTLEFVRDGETGRVVLPHEQALASAIEDLAENPDRARAMGAAGRSVVAGISWRSVVDQMITPWSWLDEAKTRRKPGEPRRILVLAPFSIDPPLGGGQVRLWNLYRELSRWNRVILVCPGRIDESLRRTDITPLFTEVRVPITKIHAEQQWDLERRFGQPVSDVALPRLSRLTPNLRRTVAALAPWADYIVSAHPYMAHLVPRGINAVRVYEAVDAEHELKRQAFGPGWQAARLIRSVRRTEGAAARSADLILAASEIEGRHLKDFYGADNARAAAAPNGIDARRARPTPSARAAYREELGIAAGQTAVLFIGSWHPPNLAAARFIGNTLAPALPEFRFDIVGSVRDQILAADGAVPAAPGVTFHGTVAADLKSKFLFACDLAINPVPFGTGTNIKVLDYMAAGLPVISTSCGIRGIAARPGEHALIAEHPQFATAIRRLAGDAQLQQRLGNAGRQLVQDKYDWPAIAAAVQEALEQHWRPVAAAAIDLCRQSQLLWGFFDPEIWPLASGPATVRWTGCRARAALAALKRPGALRLTVLAPPPGSDVRLFIDGAPVLAVHLEPGWRDIVVPIADETGRAESLLDIETSGWCPAETGHSADPRTLGIAVSHIALRELDE